MRDLITEFWLWLNISKEEYMSMSEKQESSNYVDYEEYMFPFWEDLIDEIRNEIDDEKLDLQSIDKILTVMALDNENEDVLDYIVDNASDEYVEYIVQNGSDCLYYNARWQLAEILGRRKTRNWKELIAFLLSDKNPYVAKRANNVWEDFNTGGR